MKKSRREFLGASVGLGLTPLVTSSLRKASNFAQSDKKLKILILGGTSFLGPHQIAYALGRGHELYVYQR
jgi:2'-hydroxyisoflavone reductase